MILIICSTSALLTKKRTNLYFINEMTNVCFDNGKFIFFNPSEDEKEELLEVANNSGI